MVWRVEFLPAADKAFGKLDRRPQRRIQKFIETRLQTDSDPHGRGEAYTGPLKGYWKYRIGDYKTEHPRSLAIGSVDNYVDIAQLFRPR